MKNLIAYSSKYGGTEKIAQVLKRDLIEGGKILDLDEVNNPEIDEFDCVFIGTSIYLGKARKRIINFCDKYIDALLTKRIGIFISCWDKSKLDEYIETSFSEELVSNSKIVYAGLIANPAQMSLLDRMVVKFVTQMDKPISDIKYQNLKELASIVE